MEYENLNDAVLSRLREAKAILNNEIEAGQGSKETFLVISKIEKALFWRREHLRLRTLIKNEIKETLKETLKERILRILNENTTNEKIIYEDIEKIGLNDFEPNVVYISFKMDKLDEIKSKKEHEEKEKHITMKSFADIAKRIGEGFESSSTLTREFNSFANQVNSYFKFYCKKNNIEISTFIKGHFYLSYFFKYKESYFYLNIPDVRDMSSNVSDRNSDLFLLIRTARTPKDFTGGTNNYIKLANAEIEILEFFNKNAK